MKKQFPIKKILISIMAVIIVVSAAYAGGIIQENPFINICNSESLTERSFMVSEEYFVNPFMGDVAPADLKTRYVDGRLVIASYTWDEIEPEKGKIDFTKAEQKNNYDYWINQKNNQYILIFHMDLPLLNKSIGYEQLNIPKWLYDEIKQEALNEYTALLLAARSRGDTAKIKEYSDALYRINNDREIISKFNRSFSNEADIPGVGTFYRYSMDTVNGTEYRGGFSPNYSSPILLAYHNKVMKAIAERYDNENTFAVLMGSVGHWGEMHTFYINDENASGRYPPAEISSKYEQAYADFFNNVYISSRMPRQVARDNNFGLHVNAFGDEKSVYDWYIERYQKGYTDYYTKSTYPAMPDFWKKAPSGGEFLYTGDQRFLFDENIESTVQQAKDIHLTWFNEVWYYMNEETTKNQEYLYSKIGYRFAIKKAHFSKSIKAGEDIRLKTIWQNLGTAPFYKPGEIRAVLISKGGNDISDSVIEPDIKNLMPDADPRSYETSVKTSSDWPKGEYSLYVGIYRPAEAHPWGIKLTIEENDYSGLYFIGNINIK